MLAPNSTSISIISRRMFLAAWCSGVSWSLAAFTLAPKKEEDVHVSSWNPTCESRLLRTVHELWCQISCAKKSNQNSLLLVFLVSETPVFGNSNLRCQSFCKKHQQGRVYKVVHDACNCIMTHFWQKEQLICQVTPELESKHPNSPSILLDLKYDLQKSINHTHEPNLKPFPHPALRCRSPALSSTLTQSVWSLAQATCSGVP